MLAPIRFPLVARDAHTLVGPLLMAAADLDPHDAAGWAGLRADARTVLRALSEAGRLPEHLAVGPADPPVVVARTLAAAWRRVSPPARRE